MVHEKQAKPAKNRALMIRSYSHRQLILAEFDWPVQAALDENNRCVKMGQCIPWDNRRYLKPHGIRFAGKSLGRPKKVTEAKREELKRLKAQRSQEYLRRIPIEGRFGQGKGSYRLSHIRAKRVDTSVARINSIFLVMSLLLLLRGFFALMNKGAVMVRLLLLYVGERLFYRQQAQPAIDGVLYQATAC
jgi:hypothetical protein